MENRKVLDMNVREKKPRNQVKQEGNDKKDNEVPIVVQEPKKEEKREKKAEEIEEVEEESEEESEEYSSSDEDDDEDDEDDEDDGGDEDDGDDEDDAGVIQKEAFVELLSQFFMTSQKYSVYDPKLKKNVNKKKNIVDVLQEIALYLQGKSA